jgi:Asp-tRNA(Asn)/Glu-tRNA(Gln) amidotransferase A subunit family amidase
VSEVLGDPIAKNSALGQFTHCGNVLDLTGIAVPAGTYALNELAKAPSYMDQTHTISDADSGNESSEDEQQRLPFGVTFLGGCRTDAEVLEIARRFEEAVKAK